jgi:hypothetical protein
MPAYVTAHALMSAQQENWLQRLNGEAITLVMAVGGFVVLLIGTTVTLVLMPLKQEEHEPTRCQRNTQSTGVHALSVTHGLPDLPAAT